MVPPFPLLHTFLPRLSRTGFSQHHERPRMLTFPTLFAFTFHSPSHLVLRILIGSLSRLTSSPPRHPHASSLVYSLAPRGLVTHLLHLPRKFHYILIWIYPALRIPSPHILRCVIRDFPFHASLSLCRSLGRAGKCGGVFFCNLVHPSLISLFFRYHPFLVAFLPFSHFSIALLLCRCASLTCCPPCASPRTSSPSHFVTRPLPLPFVT